MCKNRTVKLKGLSELLWYKSIIQMISSWSKVRKELKYQSCVHTWSMHMCDVFVCTHLPGPLHMATDSHRCGCILKYVPPLHMGEPSPTNTHYAYVGDPIYFWKESGLLKT